MVAALVGMATPLLAQTTTAPFTVEIGEMEKALANPSQEMMMRVNGFSQDVARNMPYVEVTNNSTANLTEFHLTIGDGRFHFSDDYFG